MSAESINYEAVIADLKAKKAQIDATINTLRALSGIVNVGGGVPPTGGGGVSIGSHIASDAFFGKSIPEATVTILQGARRKMSTQALIEAMVKGGLPPSKYNTVYAILRRRESQVGDIINMQGEWGLAAWYPNHTKKPKRVAVSEEIGIDPDPDDEEGQEIDRAFEETRETA